MLKIILTSSFFSLYRLYVFKYTPNQGWIEEDFFRKSFSFSLILNFQMNQIEIFTFSPLCTGMQNQSSYIISFYIFLYYYKKIFLTRFLLIYSKFLYYYFHMTNLNNNISIYNIAFANSER